MANKIAVVTGAGTPGYSRGITECLLANGYEVYGTYQKEDKEVAIEYLHQKEGLKLFEVNLQTRKEISLFVDGLPQQIDLLVNAQFYWNMEDPDNFNHDLWDISIAINLTARNYLMHRISKKIVDGGNIISITSTEAFSGSYGGSAYAAARAAEHNLIKTFANNLGNRAIRVNAIATGWIGSVMDTDEIFNMSRQITPLGRLGTIEEVGKVVAFLASEDASFVNGHVLVMDGGYTCVDAMAKYEYEESRK